MKGITNQNTTQHNSQIIRPERENPVGYPEGKKFNKDRLISGIFIAVIAATCLTLLALCPPAAIVPLILSAVAVGATATFSGGVIVDEGLKLKKEVDSEKKAKESRRIIHEKEGAETNTENYIEREDINQFATTAFTSINKKRW